MPDHPQDRYAGYHAAGPRWPWNAGKISDSEIDKALRAGENPRKVFAKKMKQMAPNEREKFSRKIKARTNKFNQGKNKPGGSEWGGQA